MSAEGGTSHEDLFAEASALRGEARAAYLEKMCGGDAAMRAEIESLLEAHDEAAGFLEMPALVSRGLTALGEEDEAPVLPERVGSYAILGLLGEGGMGTVYLARQEGTSREVAIKVMRVGIGGYVSAGMRQRFQQEARTLAMLHHPGIAQVYEAGVAEAAGAGGRAQPFFAMELVDGKPLQVYARERGLDARERLELIAQVCDAVEHAHQRGVIHRDLKPANVLVDKQGRPKVLDFGVARATVSDSSMATMHTRPGQLIGTLAYMAPEQVAGDPKAVDGRCDVYALGVMLFELLAGRVPFDDGRGENTPLPEMLRKIREEEAPALGTRSGEFRGDIETIVGKALEKEPAKRYASAAAMGEDIRRHLRDEPILARPPSAMVQAKKFVRRNRALVGATSAVFVALVVLVAGVSSALVRALAAERVALEQRQEARSQALRAEAVSQFLQEMLSGVDPAVAKGADTTLLRRILDVAADRAEKLSAMPEVESKVRMVIGGSYMFAGLLEEAEVHLQRAHDIRREVLGDSNSETCEAANRLAVLYHQRGRYEEAERLYREVLDARRGDATLDERWVFESANNLAALYLELDRTADAEPLCIEAVEGRKRVLGAEHEDTLESMANLGGLYWRQGRMEEVVPLWMHVLEARRRAHGEEHPATLSAMNNVALVWSRTGRAVESLELFQEVVERRKRVLGPEHPDTLRAMMNLAQGLVSTGRLEEGEAVYTELLAVQPGVLGNAHLQTLALLNNLASLYLSRGRAEEAEALLTRVVENAGSSLPAGNVFLPSYIAARAVSRAAQKRYAEAETDLLEAYRLLAASGEARASGGSRVVGEAGDGGTIGSGEDRRAWVVQMLVKLYEEWERPEDAAEWRARLPEAVVR